jgi:hypothetical protein
VKKLHNYILAPLILLLIAPVPGWPVGEADAAGPERTVAALRGPEKNVPVEKGRGEGFQPYEKEEAGVGDRQGKKEEGEYPPTFGPIVTDTAIPIEKGKFSIQPTFSQSFTTDNFNQDWRRVSAGGDFQSFSTSWRFTYGLVENLEVYAVIPYVHKWARNVDEPGPDGVRSANFGGLGDISLTLKYRLLKETETLPTVAVYFTPTFPSGQDGPPKPRFLGTDLIGSGSYVFTTGLNLSKLVKPFILYANFWYSMQTDKDNGGRQYPRDFVTVNLAAEYPITDKWVGCLEMISRYDGGRLIGRRSNVSPGDLISIAPEIEYIATERFSLSLGVQCDVAGKNTAGNITPLLSMVYAF